MEQKFENRMLNASVRTVGDKFETLFYAKDVAVTLGYRQPRKAVWEHIWEENKCTLEEFCTRSVLDPVGKYRPDTILINEQGLYQLIFKSRLPIAKDFQRWVINDVLPSIRKTGTYTVPKPRSLEGEQVCLLNENDLHYKVVEYIRKNYPKAIIIAGLGEFQTTKELRIEGWKKGYTVGQPDIIITNPSNGFTGLAIEFKTPRGTEVVSPKQYGVMHSLREQGFKTLISNNFADIVVEVFNRPGEGNQKSQA
jgi:prophage antirepressor-like protein